MDKGADIVVENSGNAEPVSPFDDLVEVAVADMVPVDPLKEKVDRVIACVEQCQEFFIGIVIQSRAGVNDTAFVHGFAHKCSCGEHRGAFQIHDIFQMDGPPEGHLVFGSGHFDVIFFNVDDKAFFDLLTDCQPDDFVTVC